MLPIIIWRKTPQKTPAPRHLAMRRQLSVFFQRLQVIGAVWGVRPCGYWPTMIDVTRFHGISWHQWWTRTLKSDRFQHRQRVISFGHVRIDVRHCIYIYIHIYLYLFIYTYGSHPASEAYFTRSPGAIGYLAPTAPMEFMAGAFGWSQGPNGLRNAALRQRIKGKSLSKNVCIEFESSLRRI